MKHLLLSLGIICFAFPAKSQFIYETADSINVNNINASVLIHGDLWENPAIGSARCEFPLGSQKNLGYSCNMAISAKENGNILHLSAERNRNQFQSYQPIDFWPGPLDMNGNTNSTVIDSWARIWKIDQVDIDNYLSQTLHTIGNTPSIILEWPAKGNQYAKGNNNASITVSEDMAPFYDINNNGQYEPLSGDYPKIKGKQMLWWVINDNGLTHNSTNGTPLKVQIEIAAYGYSNGTLIDNVVYYDFTIKNRSGINYTDVRFGQLVDFDLGLFSDDYVGFDSSRRMGYVYNADDLDGALGNQWFYGTSIPIGGLTFVHLPGDNGNNYVPLGCFDFNNSISDSTASYYDAHLHTLLPYFNECQSNNPAGDRHFIIGSNGFTLNAGASESIVTALVVTDPGTNTSCPSIDTNLIRIVADTAWGHFTWPLSVSGKPDETAIVFNIYPNPVTEHLTIESHYSIAATDICIYDVIGRKQLLPITIKDRTVTVDTQELPTGIYTILISYAGSTQAYKFRKK